MKEVAEDLSPSAQRALLKIKRTATLLVIVILLFTVTVFLSATAAIIADISNPFQSFFAFEAYFPVLGIFVIFVMYYTESRNLMRSVYLLNSAIVITYAVVLVILSIWMIIELTWYCPTMKPLYCTNGVTSNIKGQYILLVVATWMQMVLAITQAACVGSLRRSANLLNDPDFGLTSENLGSLLQRTGRPASDFVKGIGEKFQ